MSGHLTPRSVGQYGQALPIGIAALMGITLLILILFNTGQVVSEKMRLDNTADAAVYSGLVWQARTQNYMAYTNRAMVANQVAIAQLVTMVSWSRYLYTMSSNMATVLGWVPYLGAALNALSRVAYGFQVAIDVVAKAGIAFIDDFCLTILSNSQAIAFNATAINTNFTVRAVVAANDPNYQVTFINGNADIATNATDWPKVADSFSSNKRIERKANVIRASRDPFTTTQRGTVYFNNGWWQLPAVPFLSYLVTWHVHREADTQLISRGNVKASTDPSNLQWEWKAKDTLSVWIRAEFIGSCSNGFFNYPCWKTSWYEVPPVGWGEAFTSSTGRELDITKRWFTGDKSNSIAEGLADRAAENIHPGTPAYHGVRRYWDIRNADLKGQNQDRRIPLSIEVRRDPASPVRTSSNIPAMGSASAYVAGSSRSGIGPGMFRADDNFAKEPFGSPEVSAVSRGEVFYQRPRGFGFNVRQDGRLEYSNLFNPYWDVHLVDPKGDRIKGWAIRQNAVVPTLLNSLM